MRIDLDPFHCPACGTSANAALNTDPEAPRPPRSGDLTVFHKCRAILVFTEDLKVRLMTDIEECALSPAERIAITGVRIAAVRAFGPPVVH